MRLHSDILTERDLLASLPANVHAYVTSHGSRKRARAFEVTLYVTQKDELHRRYGNSGGYGSAEDVAATWDEWGTWMQNLYYIDPDALIGWYSSYHHFLEMTMRDRAYHRQFHKPTSLAYRTHTAPWLDSARTIANYSTTVLLRANRG